VPTVSLIVLREFRRQWKKAKENLEVPKTVSELVDGGLIVCGSFIVHRPSGVDDLQLSIVDQVDKVLFEIVRLVLPPLPKKCRLHLNEPDSRFNQFITIETTCFQSALESDLEFG
jgi:hypothetical protein